MLARIRVALLNLLAAAGTLVALAPLLVHRRPLGHRAQVPRRPASRVIALQRRRQALPP